MNATRGLLAVLSLVCHTDCRCSPTSYYKNCWIRRFPGVFIDTEESQRKGAQLLSCHREDTALKCSRSCCLTRNFSCNLAVFHFDTTQENCFHLHCPTLESCILKHRANVVLYNITNGVDPDLLVFGKHFTSNVRVLPHHYGRVNASEPLPSDKRHFMPPPLPTAPPSPAPPPPPPAPHLPAPLPPPPDPPSPAAPPSTPAPPSPVAPPTPAAPPSPAPPPPLAASPRPPPAALPTLSAPPSHAAPPSTPATPSPAPPPPPAAPLSTPAPPSPAPPTPLAASLRPPPSAPPSPAAPPSTPAPPSPLPSPPPRTAPPPPPAPPPSPPVAQVSLAAAAGDETPQSTGQPAEVSAAVAPGLTVLGNQAQTTAPPSSPVSPSPATPTTLGLINSETTPLFSTAPHASSALDSTTNDTKVNLGKNHSAAGGEDSVGGFGPGWSRAAHASLLVAVAVCVAAVLGCCCSGLLVVGWRGQGRRTGRYRSPWRGKGGSMRLVKYVLVRESS